VSGTARPSHGATAGPLVDRSRLAALLAWLIVLWLAACAPAPASTPADYLPAPDAVAGWTRTGAPQTFTPETLYDLVDGQAEAFLAYGMDSAALGRYSGPDGATLRVEIFRLASQADAYGLYSVSIAGERVAVGSDGDTEPGRRLAFWSDRYFVRIQAAQPIARDDLLEFGRAVSRALPAGAQRPAVLQRLPAAGLEPRSARFFRSELSIQSWLWLGGKNLLGLGSDVEGVLADYDLHGDVVRLLLVIYPEANAATSALTALQSDTVDGLLTARVAENRLGAVFGSADRGLAETLLEEALR
jgi:hypothetical protein